MAGAAERSVVRLADAAGRVVAAETGWSPSRPGVSPITYDTLASFLCDLFAALRSIPDGRLHVATVRLAGEPFKVRSSRPDLLARYLGRLAAVSAPAEADAHCIDVVAAEDLGWSAAAWAVPDWQMHVFDAAVGQAGYMAEYPYFDAQWVLADPRGRHSTYFLNSFQDLHPWDSGSPLRVPLQWAMQNPRRWIVHAGTLGHDGAGALLVGPGGAGKSGTTLAGLAAGLHTVGDDYVVLDQDGPPTALPMYRFLKQDPAGLARVPGLAERFRGSPVNWQGKHEFDAATTFPGCFQDRLALSAILLPRIAGERRSRLHRLARPEAVRLLAAHLLPQPASDPSAGPDRESILFLGRLVAQLPVYVLHLSSDATEIAGVCAKLLTGPGAAADA